jgi:hypothetical protein
VMFLILEHRADRDPIVLGIKSVFRLKFSPSSLLTVTDKIGRTSDGVSNEKYCAMREIVL